MYSGGFSSFASLRASIEAHLATEGWTVSGDVYSRDGLFIRFTDALKSLTMNFGTGESGGALTGAHTYGVKMMSPDASPMTFPASYVMYVHDNPSEVFIVVNYNTDKYQHMNFGTSDIEQIGGTGGWATATYRSDRDAASSYAATMFIGADASGIGVTTYDGMQAGFFLDTQSGSVESSYIHNALDSAGGWYRSGMAPSTTGNIFGSASMSGALLHAIPSQYSQSAVLLPLRAVQARNSGGQTTVLQMRNARLTRIDNYAPGETISYGGEDWDVYPIYRKNATQRNGVPWATGAEHSGTLAVAIRQD